MDDDFLATEAQPMQKKSPYWTVVERQAFMKHSEELENEQRSVRVKDRLTSLKFHLAISTRLAADGIFRSADACAATRRRYIRTGIELNDELSAEEDTKLESSGRDEHIGKSNGATSRSSAGSFGKDKLDLRTMDNETSPERRPEQLKKKPFTFTESQTIVLKRVGDKGLKPSIETRQQLADELGINRSHVDIWFHASRRGYHGYRKHAAQIQHSEDKRDEDSIPTEQGTNKPAAVARKRSRLPTNAAPRSIDNAILSDLSENETALESAQLRKRVRKSAASSARSNESPIKTSGGVTSTPTQNPKPVARTRHRLTDEQTRILKLHGREHGCSPDSETISTLSEQIGLTYSQVRGFFANARRGKYGFSHSSAPGVQVDETENLEQNLVNEDSELPAALNPTPLQETQDALTALPSASGIELNTSSVIDMPPTSNPDQPRDPYAVLNEHERAIVAFEGSMEKINDYMVSNRGNIEKLQLQIEGLRDHLETREIAMGKLKAWEDDHQIKLSKYEEEIHKRKEKMTAIQNALNVDWDALLK